MTSISGSDLSSKKTDQSKDVSFPSVNSDTGAKIFPLHMDPAKFEKTPASDIFKQVTGDKNTILDTPGYVPDFYTQLPKGTKIYGLVVTTTTREQNEGKDIPTFKFFSEEADGNVKAFQPKEVTQTRGDVILTADFDHDGKDDRLIFTQERDAQITYDVKGFYESHFEQLKKLDPASAEYQRVSDEEHSGVTKIGVWWFDPLAEKD